ncbi:hypothetical protein [Armatimonas sp.]|uniref:hypothetical protein n=1 Tax=Armatimonas sp. TaxID=1872638 RepID=UPI00286C42E4|nr:hypothetical protein [Armatimonas sp.]
MQTSLERAWQEWESFCTDMQTRIQEAVASGLEPRPPQDKALRAALAALTAEELMLFLDDPRLEEHPPEPGTETAFSTRVAILLCVLPPHAALPLAQRFDDPCRAKSNLPPRASLALFLTFRWKQFLIANLRREGALIALQANRFQITYFVARFGDETMRALLRTSDPPGLTRELAKVQKQFSERPQP